MTKPTPSGGTNGSLTLQCLPGTGGLESLSPEEQEPLLHMLALCGARQQVMSGH